MGSKLSVGDRLQIGLAIVMFVMPKAAPGLLEWLGTWGSRVVMALAVLLLVRTIWPHCGITAKILGSCLAATGFASSIVWLVINPGDAPTESRREATIIKQDAMNSQVDRIAGEIAKEVARLNGPEDSAGTRDSIEYQITRGPGRSGPKSSCATRACVFQTKIGPFSENSANIEVFMKNTGSGPAMNFTSRVRLLVGSEVSDADLKEQDLQPPTSSGTLVTGLEARTLVSLFRNQAEVFKKLQNGEFQGVIYGQLDYDDEDGMHHYTRFCSRWLTQYSEFVTCPPTDFVKNQDP